MADNSSSNGNSWTILAPEESGVESMGPVSDGQGGVHAEPALTKSSVLSDTSEQTGDPPQVTPLEGSEDAAVTHSTSLKEDSSSSIPVHVESLTSLTPDPEEQEASGTGFENQPLIDTESFSDSYTHIRPSSVFASLPGALEEEEEEEELSQGEDKSEPRKTLREEFQPEERANEGEGVRRRNVSVLTPLYHRDEEEEEEVEEEQFRHPRREGEGDIGFTLNKCIFGALVLLGLGTIFFSGVLIDLDDEGDADSKDLKYSEANKDYAQGDIPGGVQPPEILDEMAKENQQIASLQAQLQDQELELKAAQLQVEEGTKERLKREELEAENQRMRGELDKLPAIQKEYEQESEMVKKESERVNKELEALPAMQKELEHLRDKVAELTQSTGNVQAVDPSAGHEEVLSSQIRKERKDKAWEKEKKERDPKSEKKEWKKDKNVKVNEQDGKGKSTKDHKEWKKEDDEQGRRKGEGKNKGKDHKQEDAQRWKLNGEKSKPKERSGKKEWKEDKKWEKEKHGEFVDRKREKRDNEKEDKEWKQKDWKEEKRDKGKEDKEWKQKDWKEEKRDKGKEDKEWKKEKREKGKEDKEWKQKDWKEEKRDKGKEDKEWKKEKRDKGKEDKEWKQKDWKEEKRDKGKDNEWKQKDGNEEKEWKKRKHTNQQEKEWKEKSNQNKDWEEKKEWDDEKERRASDDEKYSNKRQKEKSRKGKKDHDEGNGERKDKEEKHHGEKEKDKPKRGERAHGWTEEKKYKDKNHKKEEKMSKKGKHEASHHSYSDQKHSKDHVHVNYWAEQREKIRHYYGSTEECADVTSCAHAEGLAPVSQQDFEAFMSGYLSKLQGDEDQTSRKEELSKLIGEFFTDGVYVHEQIPFSEFVEDVGNILEDMADGDDDDDDDDEDDDDDDDEEVEKEMELFVKEAMEKFRLQEKGGSKGKRGKVARKG